MEITCLPSDGNKIDTGFYCELTGTGNFGALTLVEDGGGNFYVDNAISGGTFLTNWLLLVLIVLTISKYIFDFFLPPRIRIKKIQ